MELINTKSPTTSESSQNNRPKPTDFDIFLPWACRQLFTCTDIVVIRATQTRNKKSTQKRKPLKPSSIAAIDVDSDEDKHSSIIDKLAPIFNNDMVKIESVYDSKNNLVQVKFLKNKFIPREVMKTIALTIPYQKYLTSMIINSGLCMESLYEISKFLPKSNITEIDLDSTFLSQANYHILLTDSKLKHLSLAKCKINDAVIKTIANQLKEPRPASRVLSALNLSSNRITDVGAKYLADMLRTNRQLSYLNLAGNMITDKGGMNILDTLHEFPLHAQEVFESRVRYVTYLKQKNVLINAFIIELQTAKFDKSPKKGMPKKTKQEVQSLQHISSQKRLRNLEAEIQIIKDKAKYLAEEKLGLFDDPFSPNKTKIRGGVVYCFGNNTLCYLNIAYNNLTYASVKKLLEVLSTQKSLKRTPRGLIKVVIEGNLMPVDCEEYKEIDQLLESCLGGPRNQSAVTKKPLHSKSPATSGTTTSR